MGNPAINCDWPSSRFVSPEITNLIRAFYYSPYRLWLLRAIERLRFIHSGSKIMTLLQFLYHSHFATSLLALSNAAMKCHSWIQATISAQAAQVMIQIATQKLNYLLSKHALWTGTKLRSKLGRLKASKISNLSLCFSPVRELWVYRLELNPQVLAFCGAHSVFMIQIVTQKLRHLSKNALAKTGIIFGSELGRLTLLKYSKLSPRFFLEKGFFPAKELWVYCLDSELICRILAPCRVHSVIRRWRYWICTLTLISLCIVCWGLAFAEQEFDAMVLPRRTRRLIIQHHSG